MGIRVKTNIPALAAQRALGENRQVLNDSLERLSSGQRINKSSDDAAGLAVSQRLQAKIASLSVSKRNANDGISYVQVAEGGLNEISNIIVRMRELTSQAASDTVGNRERLFLDKEFQQLRSEVGRIQESTEFNGSKLLTGENNKPMRIFVGASNRGDVNGKTPEIDPEKDPDVLTIDLKDLKDMVGALKPVVTEKSLMVVPNPDDLTEGGANDLGGTDNTGKIFNTLDTALDSIASYRATIGSVQSRLNSAINNIDISSENMAAARSRIRDVDYAEESTRYTQAQILSSAGTAVLSQANQMPEVVLGLIK